MIINHNLSAMFANRTLGNTGVDIGKDIEKLSSGQRINRAGDDASGLAVSEKLRSQIRGLNQATKNIENGIAFIQTSEGYLGETEDIIHRMRELAVQGSNGVYTSEDRMQIQVEVSQLVDEINRIASHAQFNGMNIMTGRFAKNGTAVMQFQVGANMDQFKQVFIGTMTAGALGLSGAQGTTDGVNIMDPTVANKSIGMLDSALKVVSKQRADLGAYQNRFEMAAKGVSVAAENLQAAESRIRDTDMASQMVDYVKNQILDRAGSAMLAQANTRSNNVMTLLG